MITGGTGQIGQAAYSEAAKRVLDAATKEFEVSPDKKLHAEALKAAMTSLERSGKIDAESMRTALEAARSKFVKAGFNQRAFATKFGAKGKISGVKQFSTDSAEYTRKMPGGEVIARTAAQLMSMPIDEAAPKLAGLIKLCEKA